MKKKIIDSTKNCAFWLFTTLRYFSHQLGPHNFVFVHRTFLLLIIYKMSCHLMFRSTSTIKKRLCDASLKRWKPPETYHKINVFMSALS